MGKMPIDIDLKDYQFLLDEGFTEDEIAAAVAESDAQIDAYLQEFARALYDNEEHTPSVRLDD